MSFDEKCPTCGSVVHPFVEIDHSEDHATPEKLDRKTDSAPDLAVYDETTEHTINYWGA